MIKSSIIRQRKGCNVFDISNIKLDKEYEIDELKKVLLEQKHIKQFIQEEIEDQKVSYLKSLLKNEGLKQSGKKVELIKRLNDNGFIKCPKKFRVIKYKNNFIVYNDLSSRHNNFLRIEDSLNQSLIWITNENKINNICFILEHIVLHQDNLHTGIGTIMPLSRQLMLKCIS